jgi:hypothetical protein
MKYFYIFLSILFISSKSLQAQPKLEPCIFNTTLNKYGFHDTVLVKLKNLDNGCYKYFILMQVLKEGKNCIKISGFVEVDSVHHFSVEIIEHLDSCFIEYLGNVFYIDYCDMPIKMPLLFPYSDKREKIRYKAWLKIVKKYKAIRNASIVIPLNVD